MRLSPQILLCSGKRCQGGGGGTGATGPAPGVVPTEQARLAACSACPRNNGTGRPTGTAFAAPQVTATTPNPRTQPAQQPATVG